MIGANELRGFTLRPYQQEAVDSVWNYLCNREGNPVVIAPTGAGKSLLIAEMARQAVKNGLSVLVLAHRKELLAQNRDKVQAMIPGASVGVYSAGLRSRDTEEQILIAGIQSVHNRAFELGERNLVIVDEAHLIPDTDSGMYRSFLADLSVSNPKHRVVGLTATAYRMDCGMIYGNDQIFSGVAHEIPIGQLIDDGFLCPVRNKSVTEVDVSGVHRRKGEFVRSEMEAVFDANVIQACEETVQIANDCRRGSILVFACGVQHAEHIARIIDGFTGEEVGLVTGDMSPLERSSTLEAFKHNRLRWLVNIDVLTTGFDAPRIDCIAVMRSTGSAGLFAQMVGRGFRLHHGKEDCLLLDFGGNLKRHGPLDSKDYGKKAKKTGLIGGGGPMKTCPSCSEEVPAGLRECGCGFLFPPPEKTHEETADRESAVLERDQKPERWRVEGMSVSVHYKSGASEGDPRTLRVNYECVPSDDEEGNLQTESISEWVCLEHMGFPRKKAMYWWIARCKVVDPPMTIEEAVNVFDRCGLADTLEIETRKEGKYRRIVDYTIGPIPEELEDEPDQWEEAPF